MICSGCRTRQYTTLPPPIRGYWRTKPNSGPATQPPRYPPFNGPQCGIYGSLDIDAIQQIWRRLVPPRSCPRWPAGRLQYPNNEGEPSGERQTANVPVARTSRKYWSQDAQTNGVTHLPDDTPPHLPMSGLSSSPFVPIQRRAAKGQSILQERPGKSEEQRRER